MSSPHLAQRYWYVGIAWVPALCRCPRRRRRWHSRRASANRTAPDPLGRRNATTRCQDGRDGRVRRLPRPGGLRPRHVPERRARRPRQGPRHHHRRLGQPRRVERRRGCSAGSTARSCSPPTSRRARPRRASAGPPRAGRARTSSASRPSSVTRIHCAGRAARASPPRAGCSSCSSRSSCSRSGWCGSSSRGCCTRRRSPPCSSSSPSPSRSGRGRLRHLGGRRHRRGRGAARAAAPAEHPPAPAPPGDRRHASTGRLTGRSEQGPRSCRNGRVAWRPVRFAN